MLARTVSEFVVRVADLVEAEGRTLRKAVLNLMTASALLVGVTVLVLGGVGLLIAGLYMSLERALGSHWAAIVLGATCLLIAGALLWLNRERLQ